MSDIVQDFVQIPGTMPARSMVAPKSGRQTPGAQPFHQSMVAFTEWPKECEDNKVSTTKHGKRIFGRGPWDMLCVLKT
jgi:hypothetical protein